MTIRPATLVGLILVLAAGRGRAAEPTFVPLTRNQGNTENRTGMWFSPDLGGVANVLPLKTRVWATRESVTGGVAMKAVFDKGSKGTLTYELGKLPAGSAGLTFFAKASRPVEVTMGGIPLEIGKEWKKYDLSWERLGSSAAAPALGWQLVLRLAGRVEERTWLILDRIGFESPAFSTEPDVRPETGPDKAIPSADILYGAENLARTRERAKAHKPFKVLALGDSVTAGAQTTRGSWGVKPAEGAQFLYLAHLARLWEEAFGYTGITPVQHGHGGWTAEQALTVVDKEIVAEAGPDDLVILQFGGNDLSWAGKSVEQWQAAMRQLIARVKTKTDQVLILSTTPIGEVVGKSPEVTKGLKQLVAEEKVAAADVLRLASYRGEPFAWAWLANEGHPTFVGHITMAEMITPVLTGRPRTYPE